MDMGLICAGMHDGSASVWFALPSDILNARLRSGHDGASVRPQSLRELRGERNLRH